MEDPFPDLHELFRLYSDIYFGHPPGALDGCFVQWSSRRMTMCGGTCQYLGRPGGCVIKLSEPLLKFRPVKDLKETLLHEMIHAYMFLTGNRNTGRDGHGPAFVDKMNDINRSDAFDPMRPPEGYSVAVHHTWSAEVESYRTHHWKCERCADLVKRAMNRPPQEADCRGRQGRGADCADPHCRFHTHQKTCGGAYVKVAEPEGFGAKKTKGKTAGGKRAASAEPPNGIKKFFRPTDQPATSADAEPAAAAVARAASPPPAQGSASAPVSAAASPDRDSMRRLAADAAVRRMQQCGEAAQSANDHREQSSLAPAQLQRPEEAPEVVVISDDEPD